MTGVTVGIPGCTSGTDQGHPAKTLQLDGIPPLKLPYAGPGGASAGAGAVLTTDAAGMVTAQLPGRGLLGTGMIPIGSNSQLNPGPTFLTGGGTFSRFKVQALQDAATMRLVYASLLNIGNQAPSEVPTPNPVKIRASIEIGNGGIAPYRYVPTTTAYAGGTTYALGARVSSAGIYYVSLQAGNVGNTPASSPAFWTPILNTGATYSAATAYVPGALAGLPSGGAYYICIAATTGNTPPNASFWAVVSSSSTAYDATITYNAQDQVTSAGLSWVCLQASTGNAPAAGSAFWQQVQYYPVPFAGQDTNRDVTLAGGEVLASEPLGISPGVLAGQYFYVNTVTQPLGRTDTATGTSGSATVTDASVTAADQGRPLAAGTGIPAGTYVGTVTPATSFLMSSSPYVQANVNATANFTTCQVLGAPSQGSYPRGNIIAWAAGDFEQHSSAGTAPDDYTLAGPTTRVSTADGTTSVCPVAVLGQPAGGTAGRPVIAIAGDSIALGTGDTSLFGGDEPLGWCLRMLTDNPAAPTRFLWTYLRMARGSSAGAFQSGPGVSAMLALAAGCTHVLDEWIVNDISLGGTTLAVLQANALARWTAWAKLGLKVIGCTSAIQATSTDSFATVANQAPAAGFGASSLWSQYNAWILGRPAPLAAVVDVAAVIQNPAAGGSNPAGTVWQPGMISLTAGAPHPSVAGHIAIAQSVKPSALFT